MGKLTYKNVKVTPYQDQYEDWFLILSWPGEDDLAVPVSYYEGRTLADLLNTAKEAQSS